MAPVLCRQNNNRLRQRTLVAAKDRCIALCPAPLPKQPTGMPFAKSVLLAGMPHRTTLPLGAYKFPLALLTSLFRPWRIQVLQPFTRVRLLGGCKRDGGGWPLGICRTAWEVDRAVLPPYRIPFSKHQFPQPQLLAILCLMRYEEWAFS